MRLVRRVVCGLVMVASMVGAVACDSSRSLLRPEDQVGSSRLGGLLAGSRIVDEEGVPYYEGRIAVRVNSTLSRNDVAEVAGELGDELLDGIDELGTYYLATTADIELAEAAWAAVEGVVSASRDHVLSGDVVVTPLSPRPAQVLNESCTPTPMDECMPWGLRAIHVDSAWQVSRGNGSTVGVVDFSWYLETTFQFGAMDVFADEHPDLDPALDDLITAHSPTSYADYLEATRTKRRGCDDVDPLTPDWDACIWHVGSHGTHVAGTATAREDGAGVVGVAPAARLRMSIVPSGYMVQRAAWDLIEEGVDVINLSIGYRHSAVRRMDSGARAALTAQWSLIAQQAERAGAVLVKSAGNDDVEVNGPIGIALSEARNGLVVGASDESNGRAEEFSNYGSRVDLYAPGVAIQSTYSCFSDGSLPCWGTMRGTSMAAPHVTGVVALIFAAARAEEGEPPNPERVVRSVLEGAEEGGIIVDGGKYLLNAPAALRAYFREPCRREGAGMIAFCTQSALIADGGE